MELTITQNGALYALQHRASKKNRGSWQKRVGTDLIWSYQALTRSIEKVQSTPQNAAAQYGFLEYPEAAYEAGALRIQQ